MSDVVSFGEVAAAGIYAAANKYNWGQNLLLPWAQAAANIAILNRQKEQYEDISTNRQRLIDVSVDRYASRIQHLLSNLDEAYPDVPQAAAYVPVDPCAEQAAQISCNINRTISADEWATTVSRLQAQSDYARMVVLDPRWYVNFELYSVTLGDMLKGQLPISDLMEITTESAEAALVTGRVGGNHRSGRRRISVERLRLQALGRGELRREASIFNKVSPTTRMASPNEMMQTPQQRIALALTQAQLIQNSLQNVYNSRAEKPPYKMAQLNLRLESIVNRLQLEASKASITNSFVPNYAAILQPVVNALSSEVGDSNSRPFSPGSHSDDPSSGGSYLEQSGGANPFTCDVGKRVGGFGNFK